MDERSDQILDHIESQRDELGRNLDELETKVRRTTDWRTHFDNNPTLMLGLALGGGMIAGSLVGGGRKSHYRYTGSSSSSWSARRSQTDYREGTDLSSTSFGEEEDQNSATAKQRRRAGEAMDQIKAALIAFGIAKSKDFLCQALPGFREYLDNASSESNEYRQSSSSEQRFESRREEPEKVGVGSESTYTRTSTELGD